MNKSPKKAAFIRAHHHCPSGPCSLINILLKGSIILKPKRFSYKDANGHDTPIYLQLEQVAAIVVTPAEVSAKE